MNDDRKAVDFSAGVRGRALPKRGVFTCDGGKKVEKGEEERGRGRTVCDLNR